ncbi:hypothetical protein ACEXQD_17020 [Herbiconiux sp. P15]|uniref:hypothetical protein n=1 Tax=Herbiconiux liukaitaii TaxID=3342799 RepID=UPI0035BA238C
MRRARRAGSLAAAAAALTLAALVTGMAAGATGSAAHASGSRAAADAPPPPAGINLQVTVAPSTKAPTAPPPAATAPGGSRTTTTTEGGSTVVTGPVSAPPLEEGEYSLGGILYISGLSTEYRPSIDPLAGELVTSFTVRNVSSSTIDSSARFWVSGPFGAELSAVDPVEIDGLNPDETTVVSATLTGVGQWTFATAHVTITPPDVVDGVPLEPMTRDAFVFLPPWFLLILLALAGVAYAVVRVVRAQSAPVIVSTGPQESTA